MSQAVCYTETQPANNVSGDETHDIGVENDLANGVRGAGNQEINPVLKIVIEIWKGGTVGETLVGRRDPYKKNRHLRLHWTSASNGCAFGRPPGSVSSGQHQALQTNLGLS